MRRNINAKNFERKLMEDLCRYIEARSDQAITLETLSKQAHLSPAYLQKRFKALIGVSPKEYRESCRMRRFKTKLQEKGFISDAIYGAGFGSSSRIYERVSTGLGMTPKEYRAGGRGVAISYATADTPLGLVMMAATDRGLCFIQFGENASELLAQLENEYPDADMSPMDAKQGVDFDRWMRALCSYLGGKRNTLDLPLDIRGTAFQVSVWKYLQTIPSGSARSYAQVARGLGRPRAVRAVARACAGNTIAVAIPCHRVIRGDGGLSGYRWGAQRKRLLLDLERKMRDKENQRSKLKEGNPNRGKHKFKRCARLSSTVANPCPRPRQALKDQPGALKFPLSEN